MHPRSPVWLSYYTLMGAKKVFKAIRNPLKAFMFYLGFFNECTLNLKYLGKIRVRKDDLKNNFFQTLVSVCSMDLGFEQRKKLSHIIAQKDKDMIEVGDVKIKNLIPLFILLEVFVLENYKFAKLKQGDIVLDIGASVADSSLYLAKEGYTVYAFEPNPKIYKIGEENLKLNLHLARKIHYINKAVSTKKGKIKLDITGESHIASLYTKGENRITVDSTTLNEIIEKYKIVPQGLKLDCEGCEYEILEEAQLSPFKEIILEYHPQPTKKTPLEIIKKLKSEGFQVNLRGNYSIGLIHAWRKKQ